MTGVSAEVVIGSLIAAENDVNVVVRGEPTPGVGWESIDAAAAIAGIGTGGGPTSCGKPWCGVYGGVVETGYTNTEADGCSRGRG